MKKITLLWIITSLVALVVVAVILLLPNPNKFSARNIKVGQLPAGQDIVVSAWPESQSVQKGDVFLYIIEVLYNPDLISEVDGDSIDKNVNLDPFEVRTIVETEFDLDSGMRVFQKQYEIQLVSGDTEHLYEFPTIVVQYKLKDVEGLTETPVLAESVYVAPRLQEGLYEMLIELGEGYNPLRPLEGEIDDVSQNRMPVILWVIGGFLAIMTVTDLTLRVIPQWREKAKRTREIEISDLICQAYSSLKENIDKQAKPRSLMHQMDHILRLVLSPKETTGWLEEPDITLVPDEVKPSVISLFGRCQQAYGAEEVTKKDIDEALKELENIFSFYFAGEMEEWKA